VNLRKYALAADLEEAGASGDSASETAAFASLYRKTRPHEQIPLPDDAIGLALRFHLLTSNADLTADQLRTICSRNGKTVLAAQEVLEQFVKEERSQLSSKARTGNFDEVGIDLSLTRAQPTVQGNDATGYKITLWAAASYKRAIYVVKEDGHYKVLATSLYPAAIGLEVLDRITANDLAGARALLDWLREDQHLEGGDDPLAGEPFPRFWTKGKDANPTSMKLAAAAILTGDKQTATQGLTILEPAAKDPGGNETEKLNIQLALLKGYDTLDTPDRGLGVCTALAKEYPESRRTFYDLSYYLRALKRLDEADQLAEDRLKRIPDDADTRRVQGFSAEVRGDYEKAHAFAKKILEEGNAQPMDLNRIAWYSLVAGKVEPSDIEDVLKAAQLNKQAAYLHTLGCLYAEVGKTHEAREILIQGMDMLNLDDPNDDYWYAFGRIAEQYGERDVALADYLRVSKPKREIEINGSSYFLSQIRLQSLRRESPK
jgi:tetratricopeptide (TPR) repeat protein